MCIKENQNISSQSFLHNLLISNSSHPQLSWVPISLTFQVLAVYLQHYPTSVIAMNLKACNHFKLYNGKAAEQELKTLMQDHMTGSPAGKGYKKACTASESTFWSLFPGSFGKDLLQHNLVVFRNGEGALQTLPALVDVIPEARLNLVIYLLRQEEVNEAYELIKASTPIHLD